MSEKYEYKVVEYNGVKTVQIMVDLIEAVSKAIPDLEFKVKVDTQRYYYVPDDLKGASFSCDVFHKTDLKTSLCKLAVGSTEELYYISNKNLTTGRYDYHIGSNGQKSIHLKNIVKIAKKTIKPLSIWQIAEDSDRRVSNAVSRFKDTTMYEVHRNTQGAYNIVYDDMMELHAIGYQAKNPEFAKAIRYVVENRERIEKFKNYNPELACVWVKENEVHYSFKNNKDDIKIVASREDLPENIKGKVCVLDIVGGDEFTEDVGTRIDSNFYWVVV